MLRVVLTDVFGNRITAEAVESMTLCRDENTPCDSLDMVISGMYGEEFSKVFLYDGDRTVYEGIVDEQITYVSDKEKTQIVSRSVTALLVDNEACPDTFNFPDTEMLFRRYLKPLGFESYRGENRVYDGRFKVSKGMSCHAVIEEFSKGTYGTLPLAEGCTVVFEKEEKEPLEFCDNPYNKGIYYSLLEFSRRRCFPVSRVWVKTESSGGYDTPVTDEEIVKNGIVRQRYLNASVPSVAALSKADEILSNAKGKWSSLTLWCPEALTDILGRKAQVKGKFRCFSNYRVSSLRYVMRSGKEETRIVLRSEK